LLYPHSICVTDDKIKAKIKYRVSAMCVVPGMFKPNIRHKVYLNVQQSLSKPPSEVKAMHTQKVRAALMGYSVVLKDTTARPPLLC